MNKTNLFLVLLVLAMVAIAGCQTTVESSDNGEDFVLDLDDYNPEDAVEEDTSAEGEEDTETETTTEETTEEIPTASETDLSKASFTVTAVEGELVKIPISAVDPDGDFVTYTIEEPFNEQGLWQTEIGDEGDYLVKVTASDGELTTTEFGHVEITRANRPPVIECEDTFTVQEGEEVVLDCNIYDTEGDVVIVSYDGWMRTATKETTFGDAGTHTVVVRAKDKNKEVFKEVTVLVKKTNRPPVIEAFDDQTIMETETFKVTPVISDPDGDVVKIAFAEPLNEDGEWETTFGDRGTYNVKVSAFDGTDTIVEEFSLTVEGLNRRPVMKEIEDIYVDEGDTVEIEVSAFDPDEDDVVLLFSGWMDSSEYTTTYDDAAPDGCKEKGCEAKYEVLVTASDGTLTAKQTVNVYVTDKNRPPVFVYEE